MNDDNFISPAPCWKDQALKPLVTFLKHQELEVSAWPQINYLDQHSLPSPYNFLLTRPLMTTAIQRHYQRTPQIQTLYQLYDLKQSITSRAVIMYVDQDQNRDNALLAKQMGQAITAELGMIHINFSALAEAMIYEIEHSCKPFGALLLEFGIATHRVHNRYFEITNIFPNYLSCNKKSVFGRSSTLLRADNQRFLAHVVEILP